MILLFGRLRDRCHLEDACCLRKDAAVQGGTSYECDGSLGQNDALLGDVSDCQHHDAIAGTSMQHVANDYQFKLAKAQS